MIDIEKTRGLVVNYVRAHPNTSFVELERLFDKNGIDWKGRQAFYPPEHPGVLMWYGWSVDMVGLVADLINDGILELWYCGDFVRNYIVDGKLLRLPLAKSARDYRNPHWMPAVIVLGDNA